jgi:uncharacterized protein YkwD
MSFQMILAGLTALLSTVTGLGFLGTQNQAEPKETLQPQEAVWETQPSSAEATGDQNAEILPIEKEVLALVNQEREKHGLKPLQLDTAVSKAADMKSKDIRDHHYFDHQSPTYGSPF